MSLSSNLRDTAVNDFKVLANEAISNSLVAFAVDATGLDNMLFNSADPMWLTSLKSGLMVTGISWASANLRSYVPMLNFF